ncbi:MAG: menaquinone biosynthesis protein [Leptospiraceae bacterium]|nr:menaquinone biosynthesis protein [Leptospiraceae bacterium]
MKIGLVKHLNAHPLDHGFRKSGKHDLVEDTPARLYAMLSEGALSTALISSVECLRNRHRFGYCSSVGVCCDGPLRSILYFEAAENPADSLPSAAGRVFADNGSRSSVALLQVLYQANTGELPNIQSTEPEKIPDLVLQNPRDGGLLIGDAALRFSLREDIHRFRIRDLGQWWKETEGLPFVFALWAYPVEAPLEDSLFEASLDVGLRQMDEIIEASEFGFARQYLTELLHYRLDTPEWKALRRFQERLQALDLL